METSKRNKTLPARLRLPFTSDRHRIEYLCTRSLRSGRPPAPRHPSELRLVELGFAFCVKLTAPLVAAAKPKRKKKTELSARSANLTGPRKPATPPRHPS